ASAFPSHAGNRRSTGRPTEAHEDMFTGPRYMLTLRGNLRFPQTMPTETDICWKLAVPKLQAAVWGNEPHSTAEQQGSTTLQPLIAGLDELSSRRADAAHGVSSLSTSTEK